MFLALIIFQLGLAVANPFHKYPYVFLLDIGNEELEKTNSEQIRVSIPGGSLAVRYPAIGEGDTIAHVRVSGIDFGTDLKANIVDGGPGYKYVVLVFMGNPGVPYDAVMTIQTVSDIDINYNSQNNDVDTKNSNSIDDIKYSNGVTNNISDDTSYDANIDDLNDSSEDTSDIESKSKDSQNAEITQDSLVVYNYAKANDDDDDYDENNDAQDKDINFQYRQYNQETPDKDYADENDIEETDEADSDESGDSTYDNQNSFDEDKNVQDLNLYERFQALKPNLYGPIRVYPQNAAPFVLREKSNSIYGPEDSAAVDQIFNDDDDQNDSDDNKDTNNNYFDSDDSSAVTS